MSTALGRQLATDDPSGSMFPKSSGEGGSQSALCGHTATGQALTTPDWGRKAHAHSRDSSTFSCDKSKVKPFFQKDQRSLPACLHFSFESHTAIRLPGKTNTKPSIIVSANLFLLSNGLAATEQLFKKTKQPLRCMLPLRRHAKENDSTLGRPDGRNSGDRKAGWDGAGSAGTGGSSAWSAAWLHELQAQSPSSASVSQPPNGNTNEYLSHATSAKSQREA